MLIHIHNIIIYKLIKFYFRVRKNTGAQQPTTNAIIYKFAYKYIYGIHILVISTNMCTFMYAYT